MLGYLSAVIVRAKGEHSVTINSTTDPIGALKPTSKIGMICHKFEGG